MVDDVAVSEVSVRPSSRNSLWHKTLVVNAVPTRAQLIRDLSDARCKIHSLARKVIDQLPEAIASGGSYLEVYVGSLEDLGVSSFVPLSRVMNAARQIGLSPCSPAVALQLRLALSGYPATEWLHIGMEPVSGAFEVPVIFKFGHKSGRARLSVDDASSASMWNGHDQFLFAQACN